MAARPRSPGRRDDAFVPPPEEPSPEKPLGNDRFEPPPETVAPEARDEDPLLSRSAAERFDPELIGIKDALETRIFSRTGAGVGARSLESGPPGLADLIVGVGIGPAHRDFESVGPAGPGAPVLNVYVSEPLNMDQAKATLVDAFQARALSTDRRPVNVIYTGVIDAYAHRHRERPSPCGISVAHFAVTAGTQGALARGRSGPRHNRLLLLSNNHVIANSNDAAAGDPIVQPGSFDHPIGPDSKIAVLEQWVPMDFNAGAVNFVDCATGWCWPDRVRREFIYRKGGAWDYFEVAPDPIAAAIGVTVGKSGRTTQLTSGRILDVNASIQVNYGEGRVGNFRDQITIRGNNNMQFSQGGDSGSLIWTWESRRRPVGLLFAGGNEFTFANKIERVLDALDIVLYT